jgi:uncharacterized repeat protein (TIGR01451 family)
MTPLNPHLRRAFTTLLLLLLAAAALPAVTHAAAPALRISVTSQPTNFAPNQINEDDEVPQYVIVITNVGSAAVSAPFTVTDTLPPGITQHGTGLQTVTLTDADFPFQVNRPSLEPGESSRATIVVDVGNLATGSAVTDHVSLVGGGAPPAEAETDTTISSDDAPFGFLPDVGGLQITAPDGSPSVQAGSHPAQLFFELGLPSTPSGLTEGRGALNGVGGGLRDLTTALPRGLVVDPGATSVRCTETQLVNHQCPEASQVGVITTDLGLFASVNPITSQLYNMVPPRGTPVEFGFDFAEVDLFVHIDGGVRAGDYSLTASATDIPAKFGLPVLGVRAELWGDPSASSHDFVRGACLGGAPGPCSVPPLTVPLLTMPSACQGSLRQDLGATSWDEPGNFQTKSLFATDADGTQTPVSGCSQLDFSPSIGLQPSTSSADSPSGLDVDLQIPQQRSFKVLAESNLKKAVVTLPQGMSLNPSAADGLTGCSEAQIGLSSQSPIAFDASDPRCPDASKVGTATIDTPLLSNPLQGTLYLADPGDNPFHTLLSGYLVAQGEGITIKLAGRFDRDPVTGQITATFDNNPQLPFSDFKLHFKSGDRGVLVTPRQCGAYNTETSLVPWSAADPNNPVPSEIVHRSSAFNITSGPSGSPCPSPGQFAPSFEAGTVTPIAGAYTPLVVKASRPDGSQPLKGLDVDLPPGLLGKLAGIPYCPQAALDAAAAKAGKAEFAAPSCPAASRVGSVDVAAGAGSTPLHVGGTAYLAGPYKGAPLSLAVVTPAVAGPFDLGTVVVRAALYVNETTAQIHAVSDPFPTILSGIPLDIRSVALTMDRPNFTLNPTSCDAMQVLGSATSTLGNVAPLQNRFQVGACGALGFKPNVAIHLKGSTKRAGNPALRATVTYPKGSYANIARASVALPHSEFLDNAHIRTVCTRVQFAEGGGHGEKCPPGSIYGHARAITPLLDNPLEGPVYLRSSSHSLPDLVAALNGQIQVVLDGTIDSVHGGIRNRFEVVPDAPVSKFVLSMQGGKRGLLENSTNLCKSTNRATVKFTGQNGKTSDTEPVVTNSCGKKGKKHHKRHR